jgi:hypothetical protein
MFSISPELERQQLALQQERLGLPNCLLLQCPVPLKAQLRSQVLHPIMLVHKQISYRSYHPPRTPQLQPIIQNKYQELPRQHQYNHNNHQRYSRT